MTNGDDPHVDARTNDGRAEGFHAGGERGHAETEDSIENARREGFDDGYVRGVTVSREIIEERIVPLIDSLEAIAIELRNALGLVGQPTRAHHGKRNRRVRPPEF